MESRPSFNSSAEGGEAPTMPGQITEPKMARAWELVAFCIDELKRSEDPLRGARLHFEAARLLEHPIQDFDGAARHYQNAYVCNPEHLPTLQGARRSLLALGSFSAALPLFDVEIRLISDARRKAMLLFEKARLLDEQLGLGGVAREALESAVALDPSNLTLVEAAERMARRAGDWPAVDRMLALGADAVSADGRMRSALLTKRARLAEVRQRDLGTATELYREALEAYPRALGALRSLGRLLEEQARWSELSRVLDMQARIVAEPKARAHTYYRLARIHEQRLNDVGAALAAMDSAVRELPEDGMLLEELARLERKTERWDALRISLERLVERASERSARLVLLERLARLREEKLNDPTGAIECYARALELDPTHTPVLQSLGRLYAERNRWPELIAMHLAEARETLDMARRAAAFARVAEVVEIHLGDKDQATQHHNRALGSLPGYDPSFKALVRLHTEAGRFRELIELYQRAIDGAAAEPTVMVAYLFKVGQLQEDVVGTPALAVPTYRRILEVDPRNLGAIQALQRAAERAQRLDEWVRALELEADRVTDRDRIVSLLCQAAEICAVRMGDTDGALLRYRKLLNLDASYVPALLGLGRLYSSLGRWEDLLEIHRKQLEVTREPGPRAALLHDMGTAYLERLGQSEQAVACWRQALEADPQHRPVMTALEAELSRRGEWKEVRPLLEAELASAATDPARARVALRIAEVEEHRLNSPEQALIWYQRALNWDSGLQPARDGLRRLWSAQRDWPKVVAALQEEVAQARDPHLEVAARMGLGDVWADELDQPNQALDCYESAIEQDPSNLAGLLTLSSLYAKLGPSENLARVLLVQSRVASDVGARVASLRQLASLLEGRGRLGQDELKQTLLAILQLVPEELAAFRALESLALRSGDSELLKHIDAKLSSLLEEPRQAAMHMVRLAEAMEVADDPSVLETYRTALLKDPDSIAAVRGLSRVARRSSDPELLAWVAEREAQVTRDLDSAAQLLATSADLRSARGDWAGAVGVLERALEINPDYRAAVDRLEEALLGRGEVNRLLDNLVRAAHASRSPEQAAPHWLRVARLRADQKQDIPAALAALRRIIEPIPNHVTALLEVAELYARDSQWAEARAALLRALDSSPTEEVAIRARLRLAEIVDQHLGDSETAIQSLRAILAVRKDQRDALGQLLDILVRTGQLDSAPEVARRLADVAEDRATRATIVSRLAKIERSRNNLRGALDAHQEAVSLVGLEGYAAREMKEHLVELGLMGEEVPWMAYVTALGRYSDKLAQGRGGSAVAMEMARVLDLELGRSDEATRVLRDSLARDRSDVDVRLLLASLLSKGKSFDQALAELRLALDLEPKRPEVWRELAAAFRAVGKSEEARLALLPLVVLGGAQEGDLATAAGRVPRPAAAIPYSFDALAFRAVDPLAPQEPASELLTSLSETLGKLMPPELERWGLSSRDRLGARSTHPLRQLADRVAGQFGQMEFDLYIHDSHVGPIEVEFTEPVALLVPKHLTVLGESQLAFLMGRILANVVRGLHAVDRLPPETLAVLLASAARIGDPSYGTGLASEDQLDQQSRRIVRAFGWRSRRLMEDAARRYAESRPPADFARWVDQIRLAASRAALIVADDLPGAVALVRRYEGDLAGIDGPLLHRGMALVDDLLRYWVSDPAMSLRRRLGLA